MSIISPNYCNSKLFFKDVSAKSPSPYSCDAPSNVTSSPPVLVKPQYIVADVPYFWLASTIYLC